MILFSIIPGKKALKMTLDRKTDKVMNNSIASRCNTVITIVSISEIMKMIFVGIIIPRYKFLYLFSIAFLLLCSYTNLCYACISIISYLHNFYKFHYHYILICFPNYIEYLSLMNNPPKSHLDRGMCLCRLGKLNDYLKEFAVLKYPKTIEISETIINSTVIEFSIILAYYFQPVDITF